MRRFLKLVIAPTLAAAIIAASFALAASQDDGSSDNSREGSRGLAFRDGPGRDLSEVAERLGVEESDLRTALRETRDEQGPPSDEEMREHEQRCTETTNAIAKELGISGDKLRSTVKDLVKQHIRADARRGLITDEQADQMISRIDDAECIPPMLGGPRGGPGHRGKRGAGLRQLARALDVSTSDLRQALESVRPAEPSAEERQRHEERCTDMSNALAEKLGISGDKVRSVAKDLAREHINQAAEDGRISDEERDQALQRLDDASCVPLLGPGGPGGPHGPGGRGIRRGFGPGGPPPGSAARTGWRRWLRRARAGSPAHRGVLVSRAVHQESAV